MATDVTKRISTSGIAEGITQRVTGQAALGLTSRVEGQPQRNLTPRIGQTVELIGPFAKLLLEDGVDCVLLQNGNRIILG